MGAEKHKQETSFDEKTEDLRSLILYNDDVNTFDYIIDSLIEVCGHDELQAEQCAMIAHYKGKCEILSGSYDELKPPYSELLRRHITVSID